MAGGREGTLFISFFLCLGAPAAAASGGGGGQGRKEDHTSQQEICVVVNGFFLDSFQHRFSSSLLADY